MKPIRLVAIASALMVALTILAQPPAGPGGPTVQSHLKLLTEKLALTDAQQAKAKPILQEMDDSVRKIMQDDSLSHQEQLDKVRPCRERAGQKLRKILNDAQKLKLDQLEHQHHSELHSDLNGAAQH